MAPLDLQGSVWVVTGCNKGMGLEYCAQLLADPSVATVVAGILPGAPKPGLEELQSSNQERLLVVDMNIKDEASVQAAAAKVASTCQGGVDVLINNAGQIETDIVPAIEEDTATFKSIVDTNLTGSFIVTKAFYPLLKHGRRKTIAFMGSDCGSLQVNNRTVHPGTDPGPIHEGDTSTPEFNGTFIAYWCSKAGIHMQMSVLANSLRDQGFIVMALHPGWVDTDNGRTTCGPQGGNPHFKPSFAVSSLLNVIKNSTTANNGQLLTWAGKPFPW